MDSGTCFNCNSQAEHNHHVVPKSMGGISTVFLCTSCHAIVHGLHESAWKNHSTLTRAALAAAKARGVELGKNGAELAKVNAAAADAFALDVRPHVDNAREAGHTSVRAIAAELNRQGIQTATGGKWHPTTVQRLVERLEALDNTL